MKLRIRDNSLRLRLTRSEVEKIGKGGAVTSSIQLGMNAESCLRYRVSCSLEQDAIEVSFEDKCIDVVIPKKRALAWALGEDVGIYSEQLSAQGYVLKVLIEKDFFCLKPRSYEQEDESDMFPNPNLERGCC